MREDELAEIRRIVLDGLKGRRVKVYLFGSRAKNPPRRTSDIDIAILPLDPLPRGLLSRIREDLEESRVVYPVDLVDLSKASPSFRRRIEHEGVLWIA